MLKVFSIFDSKAAAFLLPFFQPTVSTAIRSCQKAVRDPDSDFSRFPEDFTLFELGVWDPERGSFSLLEAPISHGVFVSFKALVPVVE